MENARLEVRQLLWVCQEEIPERACDTLLARKVRLFRTEINGGLPVVVAAAKRVGRSTTRRDSHNTHGQERLLQFSRWRLEAKDARDASSNPRGIIPLRKCAAQNRWRFFSNVIAQSMRRPERKSVQSDVG